MRTAETVQELADSIFDCEFEYMPGKGEKMDESHWIKEFDRMVAEGSNYDGELLQMLS